MKIYAYIAALVLLAGVVGYGVHIVRKANRVDVAEARAEAAEKGRAADMKEVVRRLDKDAAERQAFIARLDAIDRRFNDIHIPEPGKLVLTKEIPGACPVTGIGDPFVVVWNDASKP